MFNILCVDGGGIRGLFAAHILQCISERLDVNLFDHFDMFAGTSTGAIIAAGLASGKSTAELSLLYRTNGPKIFRDRKKSMWPMKWRAGIQSRYERESLLKVLKDEFGDALLGDVRKPLLIPATDLVSGDVHVFKSGYSPDFTRDRTVLVWQAVAASCSAPTYFDPIKVDSYLLADGGVWANNPTLAAVIDAHYRLHVDLANIRVLSLGTGRSKTAYRIGTNKQWGLLTGWGGTKFIDFLVSLQTQSISNYVRLLLDGHQLLRLQFESDSPLPLDDVTMIGDLISGADRTFTHMTTDLKSFFSTTRGIKR